MIRSMANDPIKRGGGGARRRGINYDVGTYTRGPNAAHPGMPWDTKASFAALGELYDRP